MTLLLNQKEVLLLQWALITASDTNRKSGLHDVEKGLNDLLEKVRASDASPCTYKKPAGDPDPNANRWSVGNQITDIENGKITPR